MDAFMTTTKRVQTDRMYQQADREAIAVVAENANMAQEKRADTMERAAQGAKQAQKPSAMETLRSLEVFGVAAGGCLTAAAGLAITGNLPAAGIVAAAGIGVYVLGGAK